MLSPRREASTTTSACLSHWHVRPKTRLPPSTRSAPTTPAKSHPWPGWLSPDVAVLLNVHPAHIENFGTPGSHPPRKRCRSPRGLQQNGTFVQPDRADRGVRREVADLRRRARGRRSAGGTSWFKGQVERARRRSRVSHSGRRFMHRALSVCAVAAMLVALERPLAMLERLVDVDVPHGRGNRIEVAGVTVIDDSYNANPASMSATLETFASFAPEAGATHRHPRRHARVGRQRRALSHGACGSVYSPGRRDLRGAHHPRALRPAAEGTEVGIRTTAQTRRIRGPMRSGTSLRATVSSSRDPTRFSGCTASWTVS